jgi:hypothetical protein
MLSAAALLFPLSDTILRILGADSRRGMLATNLLFGGNLPLQSLRVAQLRLAIDSGPSEGLGC